jgi:hypothetical protein
MVKGLIINKCIRKINDKEEHFDELALQDNIIEIAG